MKPVSTTLPAIVLALYCYGTPIGPGIAALSDQIARRAEYGQDLANFQSASEVSSDATAESKDKKPEATKYDNNEFYDPDPDSTFNESQEGGSDAAVSLSGDATADISSGDAPSGEAPSKAPTDAPSGDAPAEAPAPSGDVAASGSGSASQDDNLTNAQLSNADYDEETSSEPNNSSLEAGSDDVSKGSNDDANTKAPAEGELGYKGLDKPDKEYGDDKDSGSGKGDDASGSLSIDSIYKDGPDDSAGKANLGSGVGNEEPAGSNASEKEPSIPSGEPASGSGNGKDGYADPNPTKEDGDSAENTVSGAGGGKADYTEPDNGAKEYGSSSGDDTISGASGAGGGEGEPKSKGPEGSAKEYGTDDTNGDAPLPGFSDIGDNRPEAGPDIYSIPNPHSGSEDHATEGSVSGKGDAAQIDDNAKKNTNSGADTQGNNYSKDTNPEDAATTADYNKDTSPVDAAPTADYNKDANPGAAAPTADYNKGTSPGDAAPTADYNKDANPGDAAPTADYNKGTSPGADTQGSDYNKDMSSGDAAPTADYNKGTNPGADTQVSGYNKDLSSGDNSVNTEPSQGEGKGTLNNFAETGKDGLNTIPGAFVPGLGASGSENKPNILDAPNLGLGIPEPIPDYDNKPSNLEPNVDVPPSLRPDYHPESLGPDYDKKPPSLRPDYSRPETLKPGYVNQPPSLRPDYSRPETLASAQDRYGRDAYGRNQPGLGGFGITVSIPGIGQIPFGLDMNAQPMNYGRYGRAPTRDIYQRRLRNLDNDYRKRSRSRLNQKGRSRR